MAEAVAPSFAIAKVNVFLRSLVLCSISVQNSTDCIVDSLTLLRRRDFAAGTSLCWGIDALGCLNYLCRYVTRPSSDEL